MSQLIRVSKAGIDVGTATDPDDMTFSSDYSTIKYLPTGFSGSVSLSGSVAFGETVNVFGTVAHDLDYFPYYQVYVQDPVYATAGIFYPNSFLDTGGGDITIFESAFMSTADLIFVLTMSNFSGGTISAAPVYVYKIFRNNLGL